MVYRGKPSAGCETCRRAKKRCTLEQPACARCVRLKKQCSGYRDTSQLQIQDETEAVQLKAEKANRQRARQAATSTLLTPPSTTRESSIGVLTPATTNTDSTSSSDDTIYPPIYDEDFDYLLDPTDDFDFNGVGSTLTLVPSTKTLQPTPDEIATSHFFNQFTSHQHWDYLRTYASKPQLDPCLALAIRACGMAALDNVENMIMGKHYAQSVYVEALGLLNAALRDPKRCKTDESLLAVSLLGYYENLICDSRESIQSWKAHIMGATQLLKLRGKQQFKSEVGRMMFRETRAQIMIHCIWDDIEPPTFLWEWEEELEQQTIGWELYAAPADKMIKICFDLASVQAKIKQGTISDVEAAAICSQIDRDMIQWSIDTMNGVQLWQYYDLEVPDSPHVWNGMVHAYTRSPAPSVWNTYRSIRILVTRTQEGLCRRLPFSNAEREEQTRYFRKVRRQMTDEICAGVPATLGHASPAFNSPCLLISAYGSVWPLFFAGTCALERVGRQPWHTVQSGSLSSAASQTSAASAQASWIVSQLEYISKHIGLKWARGITAVLKGDFRLHMDLLPDDDSPPWIRKIEESGRGAKVLLEKEDPLAGRDQWHVRHVQRALWVGKDVAEDRVPA